MKAYLITGGSGLIGSQLITALRDDNLVFVACRKKPKTAKHANVKWLQVDFTQNIDIRILPKPVDVVVHLAQSEYFRNFPERALNVFQVNTLSTLTMLSYAHKFNVSTFIYASSGGVYGYSDIGFTEKSPVTTNGDLGFYLGTKLCSEILTDCYAPFLNIVNLRFFFVYGPNQRKSMLIPRLVESIRSGCQIGLKGDGGIQLNPTYVSDAVNAIIRAAELNSNQKINVAGPQVLSMRDICEIIGLSVGRKPYYNIQPAETPKDIVGDITKFTQLLGGPKVRFEEGIKKYLNQSKL